MRPVARLALFALLLACTFGAAAAVGAAIDPEPEDSNASHEEDAMSAGHTDNTHESSSAHAARAPAGLSVAEGGLRLALTRNRFDSGAESQRLSFRIVDEHGEAVREFETEHARRMHLIVVRRDLAEFQHVHPRMEPDGTWSTDVRLPRGGVYRVYADFQRGGKDLTLATDLHVDGEYRSLPLPPPSELDRTGRYEVRLRPDVRGLEFEVSRDGERVTDLEEYLGAGGHLVALRDGDLAFLHTHPEEVSEPGTIRFAAEYPSAGSYRLFLQFKHGGRVHTAEFTHVESKR